MKMISPASSELKMVNRENALFELEEDALVKGSFSIIYPQNVVLANNMQAEIALYSNNKLVNTIQTNFVTTLELK